MPDYAQMNIMSTGASPQLLSGTVGQKLMAANMNHNVLKPWIGTNGRTYVTMMVNGTPTAIPAPHLNATLRKDEWLEMDTSIITAAQERLVGVGDLYARDLVYRIGNGLGKTVLEYEDVDDLTEAELTMDAITPSKKDRPNYELKYLPLPIVHKDFAFNIRALTASRNAGQSLDTTTGQLAAREVAEKVESMLFTGASTYKYGGGTLYGYTDFPQRNTVTLSVNWDASAKTGANILDDCKSMKQASIDAKHYGPWVLYIPTAYETVLDDDFKSESDKTIRQRILEISGINEIKVADKLTANNVLLVQMTADTVRIVEALPITTVEWDELGGFLSNYKVLTIMVPQIRADQNGNCGVTQLVA